MGIRNYSDFQNVVPAASSHKEWERVNSPNPLRKIIRCVRNLYFCRIHRVTKIQVHTFKTGVPNWGEIPGRELGSSGRNEKMENVIFSQIIMLKIFT